jgi:hypothetical protein
MPRNGSGVYTLPPGTEGIPDTTIESGKYNSFVGDVQTDFNAPRPIVAGGTGAASAAGALTALGAVAKAGDTMAGPLTLPAGDPIAALHAVHKQYVDNAIGLALAGMFPTELRFNRSLSQHMTRLFTTTSSGAWTLSMWVRRVGLGTHQSLFGIESGAKIHIGFAAGNQLSFFSDSTIVAVGPVAHTDTTIWLNIVWTAAAGAPASPKFHTVYVNNVSGVSGLIGANGLNSAETHYIGQPSYYPDVIMKDVVFVDGAIVPATSFGHDVGGVWTPTNYLGTFGLNGFKLNFANAVDRGRDISGAGNHWTAVNF